MLCFMQMNRLTPLVVTQQQRQFEVTLSANPSTGYSWQLLNVDELTDILENPAVSPQTVKSSNGLLGAPVTQCWSFAVKSSALAKPTLRQLRFVYQRPGGVFDETDQQQSQLLVILPE